MGMSETIHETLTRLSREYEKAMLKAFEQHGYSIEWLTENYSRVSFAMEHGGKDYDSIFRYYVDQRALFEIKRIFVADHDKLTYNVKLEVLHLQTPKQDGDTLETED